MSFDSKNKKTYGLIIPKAKLSANKKPGLKPNIFGDDSDEEDVPVPGKKIGLTNNSRLKTQTQLEIQKALDDDPSVYEYDAVYDDMQQKKIEKNSTLIKGKDKKSKYIQNLLKASEERKKDDERRKERSVQKERDVEKAEGKFEDKEQFVTSAYKQKLIEMEKEAEEERRKAALEDAMDVTKQKDLSGFYRHFLNQQTGEEEIPSNVRVKKEEDTKPESVKKESDRKPKTKEEFPDDRDDVRSTSGDSDSDGINSSTKERSAKSPSKRQTSGKFEDGGHHRKSRDSRSSSPRHHKSRSQSQDRKRSPHKSRPRKSRSKSPHKSRSHRSRSRSHRSRSRSRQRDERRRRRSRSRSKSHSPRSHGRQNREKEKGRKEDGSKKPRLDEGDTASTKDVKKDTAKSQSLAEKFAKRNVGSAADDARARYMARKKQRSAVVEVEEN